MTTIVTGKYAKYANPYTTLPTEPLSSLRPSRQPGEGGDWRLPCELFRLYQIEYSDVKALAG